MSMTLSRRSFIQSTALLAAASAASNPAVSKAQGTSKPASPAPFRLGIASYTFRNFSRAQMIGYLKQMNVSDVNLKDAKDHLPTDQAEEAKAVADYAAAGRFTSIGTTFGYRSVMCGL